MAFRVQEYGYIFAVTTRNIARAVFLMNTGNYVCGYHAEHRSVTATNETAGRNIGVPGVRSYGKKKKDPVVPTKGCFHCGCLEDEVLFDFFLWKDWFLEHEDTDTGMQVQNN